MKIHLWYTFKGNNNFLFLFPILMPVSLSFFNFCRLKVNRTKEGVVLTDVEPTLSCRLSAYLTRAADWTIKGCLATLTALALYVGVRWWLGRAARHREDVYLMAGNIVDVVSARVSATGDAFTPIELVRDELIPLRDRQRCRRVWEDAVRLLDSDTRLRKEIQEVSVCGQSINTKGHKWGGIFLIFNRLETKKN